jgi:CSLREA domain-containing protein
MRGTHIVALAALLPAICLADQSIRVAATYHGAPAAVNALSKGTAHALGMASADFNEDGFPDIVAAYDTGFGGALAVHYGIAAQPGTSPFHPNAHALSTLDRPDFVAAGDFNADGHFDLVIASRGAERLYFFAGDGKGGFAAERHIALPGRITAFASGEVNRADGLADLVIAVSSGNAHRLLVFESPRGALNAEPEVLALPAPGATIQLPPPGDAAFHDILIGTPSASYRLRSRDRKLSLPDKLRNVSGPELDRLEGPLPAVEALPDGTVASLPVRFSGSRAGNRIELPAEGVAPRVKAFFLSGFVVNSEADTGDSNLSDGVCDTGTSTPTGICTLRAAIQQANHNGVTTSISFANNVNTIVVGAMLPETTVPITIDGLTGRSARVQLDGRNSFNGDQIFDPSGLGLYGGNSTLTGMTIYGFVTGVKVASANSGGNIIQNNWIGMDNTGAVPSGRRLTWGILLENYSNAGNNLIGGTAAGQGNVISTGNSNGYGIEITSASNTVQGNYIGTNPAGSILIGNGHPVFIADSSNNQIGGATAGAGNVIAGNPSSPAAPNVQINTSNALASNNIVQGNFIGTDATGTIALGGVNGGIYVYGPNTTIGGAATAARNIISGNGAYGAALLYAGAIFQGNYVGSDVTGTIALANGCCGVQVQASSIQVGGTGSAGNLVSGNSGPGITINQSGVTNTSVLGNIVGLNASGTAALGNTGDGVNVTSFSSSNNNFGAAGAGNVISGNGGNGIYTANGPHTIQGNIIGLNAAGTAVIGNASHGILASSANPLVVGGSGPGQGNVISGNGGSGIDGTGIYNFTIQNNQIGTDSSGTLALGNSSNGISFEGYFGLVKGNTIANNSGDGIFQDSGYSDAYRGNSIFANASGGIVETNGANYGIAAPVLTTAYQAGGGLQIAGTVSSAPLGYPATLEFFANNGGDSPVEGRTSLGTATVNSSGSFNVSLAGASAALITATVTDNGAETSPFSNAIAPQSCSANVSAQAGVAHGPMRYSPAQQKFLQVDTLTNTGATAIAAPIYVTIDNLSANATLANANGTVGCNVPASPYVKVLSSGSLAQGASLSVQLQFSDPSLTAFTYSTRVLAGAGQP